MPMERDAKGKLLPGSGGRPAGARNKLQAAFIDAMQKDFTENGADTIKIVRIEQPATYLKILASVLPKEMLFSGDALEDLTDTELTEALAIVRRAKGKAA